jgi:hypothetical protein
VFDDNVRYFPLCVFSAGGEPISCSAQTGRLIGSWFRERFYLARLLKVVRQSHVWPIFSDIEPTYEQIYSYYSEKPHKTNTWNKHVSFFLSNIQRIIRITRNNQCKIFITTYPHRQQIIADEGGQLWHREVEFLIRDLCNREQVPFFSAFAAISQYLHQGNDIYWKQDMHFTPTGQQLWANQIADFVTENW